METLVATHGYGSKNLKAAAKYSQGRAALKPGGYVHCRTPTFNSPIIRTESQFKTTGLLCGEHR
jgi:hypothetical protein